MGKAKEILVLSVMVVAILMAFGVVGYRYYLEFQIKNESIKTLKAIQESK